MAVSQFDDLHRDLFGGDGAFGSYRLLQGFDNKTLEVDRGLWALSRTAQSLPQIRKVFEEQSAAEVMCHRYANSHLKSESAGRASPGDIPRQARPDRLQ